MGDIFDDTLKAFRSIERANKLKGGVTEALDDAKIFVFDVDNAFELEESFIDDGATWDNFYLPYKDVVIIANPYNMALISDIDPNQTGFNAERMILSVKKAFDPDGFLTKFVRAFCMVENEAQNLLVAFTGRIAPQTSEVLSNANVEPLNMFIFSPNGKVLKFLDLQSVYKEVPIALMSEYQNVMKEGFDNLVDYFSMIRTINSQHNFILQKTPLNRPRIPKKKAKRDRFVLKREYRPQYTVLTPNKIREVMRLPKVSTGKGTKKRPHERRKTIAFLQDKKYRFDDEGRLLEPKPIPWGPDKGKPYYKMSERKATWIGAKESIVGNHRYRVILDR